jgi:serine/threonine protein kinase
MGTVYRCAHVELNYPYAIKILLPDWASADPNGRRRMRREAVIARRLNHPNLVKVHDCGTNVVVEDEEGRHRYEEFFLVMDLLEGESLKDYLLRKGALPLEEAVAIARQVADGLSELHSNGILHRDVKPANVVLTRDGEGRPIVKIVDLGAVKFVERSPAFDDVELTGEMMVGSARYTSPENCKGQPLDQRSDVYCLGLILYEMLAGSPPFDSNDRVDLIYKHAYVEPRSLAEVRHDVPESVVSLVMSSLKKSPEARPQSAAEFVRALPDLEAFGSTDAAFGRGSADESEVDEETRVVVRPPSAPTPVPKFTAGDSFGTLPAPDGRFESFNEEVDEEAHGFDVLTHDSQGHVDEVIYEEAEAASTPAAAGRREVLSQGKRTALAFTYFLAFAMTALFLVWSLLSKGPAAASAGDASPAGASSESRAINPGDDFITSTDVNIRSGPSRNSQRIGLAEQGSRVRVISASGNWREVRVLEHGRPKEDESSQDQGWLDGGLLRTPDE